MYIDSHCHLDFPVFKQKLSKLLLDCQLQKVSAFVIPSIGESNWQRVNELCQQHPCCYPAFGIHPCFLDDFHPRMLASLKLVIGANKAIAIGEIGLDSNVADLKLQELVFRAQCDLALEYKLPILVHSRKTHDKISSILKSYDGQLKGIIHGFSGTYQQADVFYRLGFKLGVGGVITYPRAKKTASAIAQLPLEALVLETDSPDMPVKGQLSKTNSPLNIPQIAEALCLLRKEPSNEVIEQMKKNTLDIFPNLPMEA